MLYSDVQIDTNAKVNLLLQQSGSGGRKQNLGFFLLFFLWPFAAFLIALSSHKSRDSWKAVYMFLILFGLTFVARSKGMDSFRVAENFVHISNLPFSDFWKIVGGLYATDTSVDIVLPFLNFILSRLTDDPAILFGVFAAIFGYFHMKSIVRLNDLEPGKLNINALIHLWFFIFLIPIFQINGFRFYTASWVFFYGVLNYLITGQKKFVWVSLVSIFFHYSFISASAVLMIYVFLGNRNILYIPILIASFIIPEVSNAFINKNISFFGFGIQDRAAGYLSEGYKKGLEASAEGAKWFIIWSTQLVNFYVYLAFVYARTIWRKYTKDPIMERLFSFSILFLSFANFSKVVPSGNRFMIVFFLFATAYIYILFLKRRTNRLSWLTLAGLFPMLLFAALSFRQGFENMNLWLFAPMPFPFTAEAITIAELFFN